MKLRLDLRLSQKLIMTPQLQQAIKLLQLSRLELQQSLQQHLMENPLLEELPPETDEGDEAEVATTPEREREEPPLSSPAADTIRETDNSAPAAESPEELSATSWEDYFDSDFRRGDSEYSSSSQDEFPSYEQTLAKSTSLEDHLLWQLSLSG